MKIIKNKLYCITYRYNTNWEEFKHVKANSIIEAINILESYLKEVRKMEFDIIKVQSIGEVLESSTKTITVEV